MEHAVRRRALGLLLYETHLPVEAILGAFNILDRTSSLRDSLLADLTLTTASLTQLMAAAWIAYKVNTTNCVPRMEHFQQIIMKPLQRRARSLNTRGAEVALLDRLRWHVSTTTRYDCVLQLLSKLAPFDVIRVPADHCTICRGPVEQPTRLDCGHTCCHGCVATMKCHGFSSKQRCPSCSSSSITAMAYPHYAAVRTMMPIKREVERALAHTLLLPHIGEDSVFARAVLWAAVHMTIERTPAMDVPAWFPHMFDSEKHSKHIIARHGIQISTAYVVGHAGTVGRHVQPLTDKKRKFSALCRV